MKICFVQPETDYQIMVNRYALSLTFPQIIHSFELRTEEYCIYIYGKNKTPFEQYLLDNCVSHVLITAITSTFPKAVEIASKAKSLGIKTAIGGIFATMNALKIYEHYKIFDYILVGHSNKEMFQQIINEHYGIVYGQEKIAPLSSIAEIVTSEKFSMYSQNDTICYEITNGCPFSCTYCTIKSAFNTPCLVTRNEDIIKKDLCIMAQKWNKLKLIDDDISLAFNSHPKLSLNEFDQVIAEIRVDNINEQIMVKMKEAGITHLLFGIETLDDKFISESNKAISGNWAAKCLSAIEMCQKFGIICRPIIMLTNPTMHLKQLEPLIKQLNGWTSENLIEVLFSFYTPHPGLKVKLKKDELINNNLKKFDHLHLVYKPPFLKETDIQTLIELYDELVVITKSESYNPPVQYVKEDLSEYNIFFQFAD